MSEEILKRLDLAIGKLGAVTAEVWPSLVSRAVVYGVVQLILSLILLGCATGLAHRLVVACRERYGEAALAFGAGAGVVMMISVQFVCWIHEAIVILAAPEADAVLRLLRAAGG